jgi:hydrogenase expression/formation protein HypC
MRGAGEHSVNMVPAGGACRDEVCVTCSDTAVAVTIVRLLDDDLAVVDTGDGEEEVSVALVDAGVGDTILVHAREAIAVTRSSGGLRGNAVG